MAACPRGLETCIANGLRASVRAVDLAAAPNNEQSAAAPTCTKKIERMHNQLMSLPNEHIGQITGLIFDRSSGAVAAERPS